MKKNERVWNRICVAIVAVQLMPAAASPATLFTYQGRLLDAGLPATGEYDLRFQLFDSPEGRTAVSDSLTNAPVAVSNGVFSALLDFGDLFNGATLWLQIGVRTNGSAADFVTLAPRQPLTAAPEALFAARAGTVTNGAIGSPQLSHAAVLESKLADSAVSSNKLADGAVTTAKLADGAVTGTKLVNETIGAGKLMDGAVTVAKLAFNAVATAHLQTGSVTAEKLSSDIGVWSRLGTNVTFDGSVGIGVTVPATALQVGGTVRATAFEGNGAGLSNIHVNALASGGTVAVRPSGLFSPATAYPLPGGALAVATADVNGDTHLDVLAPHVDGDGLAVYTNNGSGGFALRAMPAVGGDPSCVVAADFNGDGRVDAAVANYADSTVSVLTNDGAGGFAERALVAVGTEPRWMVSADFNGDGRMDLATANQGGISLSVLTNSGTGGFVLAQTVFAGALLFSLAAADLNDDGKTDLVTANALAFGTLTLVTNRGNATFATFATLNVGDGPRGVAAADLNGDGRADLISANSGVASLTVLTNSGSSFIVASTPTVGSSPRSVAASDINGDGQPDLLCANYSGGTVTALTNNGHGAFVPLTTRSVNDGPNHLLIGDLNHDGRADAVVASFSEPGFSVLFGEQAGFFAGVFSGDGGELTNLDGQHLQDGSVDGTALASGAVTADKLGANVGVWSRLNTNVYYSQGNVGIRTSTPDKALQVRDGTGALGNGGNIHLGQGGGDGDPKLLHFGDLQGNGLGYVYLGENGQDDTMELRAARFFFNSGNLGLGTNNPAQKLHVIGNILASGTVTSSSDRNAKENFQNISARQILEKVAALPIARWSYRADPGTAHIGPMAQDFHAAFDVGADERSISMVDADGVALAAVQGLYELLRERDAEIDRLKRRTAALEELAERIERVEQFMIRRSTPEPATNPSAR